MLNKFVAFVKKILNIRLSDYDYYLNLNERYYPDELIRIFKKNTGKDLNLTAPTSFNEKIQWLKLYDNSELKTKLTDKIAVRAWIAEKIGTKYLKHIFGIWNSFEDINYEQLPSSFVLKTNHGSRMNYVVKDKQKFLENDIQEAKKQFNVWLNTNYAYQSGFELQYKNIPPKIYAEEFINSDYNDIVEDYEFYCFNGEPKLLMYSSKKDNDYKSSMFDNDFNRLPFRPFPDEEPVELTLSPSILKMREMSKILSKNFKFVRVDFMCVKHNNISQPNLVDSEKYNDYVEEILFTEMTFSPRSGYFVSIPDEYNNIFGSWIDLDTVDKELIKEK